MINQREICGRRVVRRANGVWICGERIEDGRTCGYTHHHSLICEHLIEALQQLPVAERVAHLRYLRGLSQQDLATAVDRSKSWMDKVERGVRGLDKVSLLEQLAEALGVHPALLLLSRTPARDIHLTRRNNTGGFR